MTNQQAPDAALMRALACPVCDSKTALFDVVDFNKSCEEAKGKYLPLSGTPVYYARCTACEFVYAPMLHQWTPGRFLREIYNDGYQQVDPDYEVARPLANAQMLHNTFAHVLGEISHLDFGGGEGRLSAELRVKGWQSDSYDPFPAPPPDWRPKVQGYNLITAFEVLEHVPNVRDIMTHLGHWLQEPGIILFSTLLNDAHIQPSGRLNWWYAAPRNGHISLFSDRSIRLLGERAGFGYGRFNDNIHVYANGIPAWAQHLLNSA